MSDAVERLRRWESSGAHWQVVTRGPDGLAIELLTCDFGEVMDRLWSADPALREYVGDRDRDDAD